MKRPIETEYRSGAAYMRGLEAYCDYIEHPAQQNPVAWKWENKETGTSGVYLENPDQFFDLSVASIYEWTPLYKAPPEQRTWVEVEQVKLEGDRLIAKLKEGT